MRGSQQISATQAEDLKAVRGSQQISATQAEDLRWSAAQNHCVAMYLPQPLLEMRKFHAIQNFQTPPTTLSEGIFSASMVSVNAFQEIYTSKGQPTNGSLRNYLKPYSRHWFPQRTISAPYLLPISKTPVLVAVEPR